MNTQTPSVETIKHRMRQDLEGAAHRDVLTDFMVLAFLVKNNFEDTIPTKAGADKVWAELFPEAVEYLHVVGGPPAKQRIQLFKRALAMIPDDVLE